MSNPAQKETSSRTFLRKVGHGIIAANVTGSVLGDRRLTAKAQSELQSEIGGN
jgi:hypothetical protein